MKHLNYYLCCAIIFFTGRTCRRMIKQVDTIPLARVRKIIEKLKTLCNRESTNRNYLSIWRTFNGFLLKLDDKPSQWEDKVNLFAAYLVEKGVQSSTLRSYISAIKCVLTTDGYEWNDCSGSTVSKTLIKACKNKND